MIEVKPSSGVYGELAAADKPVVGKRNEFTSTIAKAEDAIARLQLKDPWVWTDEARETFRLWLIDYSDGLVRWMAFNFGTGAQRGIEQTAHLLSDPDYYDTLKNRRIREAQREKEREKKDARERDERKKLGMTAAEVEQLRERLERELLQSSLHVEECKRRLSQLPRNPRLVRFSEVVKKDIDQEPTL